MYKVEFEFAGSPSVSNRGEQSFDSYVKALKYFNALKEEDRKERKTAKAYNNYYFGDIGLYRGNKLIDSN